MLPDRLQFRPLGERCYAEKCLRKVLPAHAGDRPLDNVGHVNPSHLHLLQLSEGARLNGDQPLVQFGRALFIWDLTMRLNPAPEEIGDRHVSRRHPRMNEKVSFLYVGVGGSDQGSSLLIWGRRRPEPSSLEAPEVMRGLKVILCFGLPRILVGKG